MPAIKRPQQVHIQGERVFSYKIVAKNHAHEPSGIDEPRSLEQVLVLLFLCRLICRRRGRPDTSFINLQQFLDDVVVIPTEDHKKCGRRRGHAEETSISKAVRVDAPSAIVEPNEILLGLIIPIQRTEIKIRGSLVDRFGSKMIGIEELRGETRDDKQRAWCTEVYSSAVLHLHCE